ncbi:aspartic peptidase A1 [Cubamyces menziesii]|nr:aspartic peptidase A1 [Cubamyces menziesii]
MLSSRFSKFSPLLLVLSHAIAVQAIPTLRADDNLISLSIAKRVNLTGSANIVAHDRARASHLFGQAKRRGTGTSPSPSPRATSINAENELFQYVVNVGIGSPPTMYELIVDTGTANTWVGAGKTYIQTGSTRQTRDQVLVQYGSGVGYMEGVEFTDHMNLGDQGLGLTITGQSIGVASQWLGFGGVDGVLGLGPTDLTIGTLYPDTTVSIPTVTDNLFSQGYITSDVVSVYFQPSSTGDPITGVLTFGGTSMYGIVGAVNYAPITTTEPSSGYWGINQGLRYGASSQIFTNSPGIFDARSTMIFLAYDFFDKYTELTGAEPSQTGFYQLTLEQYANLQSLFFTINNVVYEFTANAQIWPRNLNSVIGGSSDYVYLIVSQLTWQSGNGMDFVNGMTFMERYYMVFDTENRRVGIANTPYTRATTN